ncbi:hypothetical protein CROQUDRAFT_673532 [Cronartium quercuum f. sp. fusiforme G11]|uniref:DUF7872 domain-containing protein n=1 Tax=Cronartium quercuum f. sp. fusiforme G11 TaxID=708437 RepID=A0A9P6NE94_9BASI|nr:hypothetical protein CROQUDRAFT_673532 [Cronartium quercuum f. sp. fusiforme G11]
MNKFKVLSIFAIISCAICLESNTHSASAETFFSKLRKRDALPPSLSHSTPSANSIQSVNVPKSTQSATNSSHLGLSHQASFNSSGPCAVYPLDQSTWNRFHWDDYLHSFPGGANLSVQDYARSVGANNFKCGIGENCNVGQLCTPVTFPDWYILLSAQHLNMYINKMYNILGFAHSLTQSTVSSIWIDLFPAVVNYKDLKAVFIAETVAAGIQVLGGLYLLLFADPALLFITVPFALTSVVSLPFTAFMLASLIVITIAQGLLNFHSVAGPPQTNQFDLWSEFNYELSERQHAAQELLANTTTSLFHAGISADNGLGKALTNGTFINPLKLKNTFEIQHDVKNATTALAISKLLRAMNAFVTIGSDPCDPNKKTSKHSEDRLSYCSPNGTLMNIIRAVPHKTKAINEFKNAHILADKYGYTTEYIVTKSWECQQKYGLGGPNRTATNLTNSQIVNSVLDCSFDLPVCDCRRDDIAHLRKKGKRTVKVCRGAGLPI